VCFDEASRLPVNGTVNGTSSTWSLVDDGKAAKGVAKLGLVSHTPGETLSLGPLPTRPALPARRRRRVDDEPALKSSQLKLRQALPALPPAGRRSVDDARNDAGQGGTELGSSRHRRPSHHVEHSPDVDSHVEKLDQARPEATSASYLSSTSCALVKVHLGYLLSSQRRCQGAFTISCVGCMCSQLTGPDAASLFPFPRVETDAVRAGSPIARINASVTATTGFWMQQRGSPCYLQVEHQPSHGPATSTATASTVGPKGSTTSSSRADARIRLAHNRQAPPCSRVLLSSLALREATTFDWLALWRRGTYGVVGKSLAKAVQRFIRDSVGCIRSGMLGSAVREALGCGSRRSHHSRLVHGSNQTTAAPSPPSAESTTRAPPAPLNVMGLTVAQVAELCWILHPSRQ